MQLPQASVSSIDDLAAIPVHQNGNVPTLLRDVASVRIDETFNNITLDGQNVATIDGGSSTVVRVQGRGITIRGFTITGGNGVVVRGGGTGVIDYNSFR